MMISEKIQVVIVRLQFLQSLLLVAHSGLGQLQLVPCTPHLGDRQVNIAQIAINLADLGTEQLLQMVIRVISLLSGLP